MGWVLLGSEEIAFVCPACAVSRVRVGVLMSHDVSEFPIGTIVNPEDFSFRLEIVRHGLDEIFARVIKAEYLYPHAQVQPFQVGQELRFVPGIVCGDISMWNLDSHNWWFILWVEDDRFRFEHYR